jgi:hypothetical protein
MDLPVILICGCKKYEEYLHAAIKRYSSKKLLRVVGIMGDPTLTDASWNEVDKILILPTPDTYEDLPKKIHAAVCWINDKWPKTPGIFKTDDDIIFDDILKVMIFIYKNMGIPYWGGFVERCAERYINPERIKIRFNDQTLRPKHPRAVYCYGLGYWVNSTAMKHIIAAKKQYYEAYIEDVCTGNVLNTNNIYPCKAEIPYKEIPRGPELLNHK